MELHPTLTSVPGVRVGHWTDPDAATGCTVILVPEHGAIAGVEVRGAAPGTRETDLLRAGTLVERIHAIVLTGGSAFGLAAADGVMRYLEERDTGFRTPAGVVPVVPAAVIYDLAIGSATIRPGAEAGYAACLVASDAPVETGSVGAGAGATVAKARGMDHAVKAGIGTDARTLPGGHRIGALMVVNASGDVVDPDTGSTIAGPRRTDGRPGFDDTRSILWSGERPGRAPRDQETNTTIGVIATDLPLTVAQANRLVMMAHSGIARAVLPSYGMGDGDTLFLLSTAHPSEDPADPMALTGAGAAAAAVVERAIVDAVRSATGLATIPSAADYLAGGGATT